MKFTIGKITITKTHHTGPYYLYIIEQSPKSFVRFQAIESYITEQTTPKELAKRMDYQTKSKPGAEQQRMNRIHDLLMNRAKEKRDLMGW